MKHVWKRPGQILSGLLFAALYAMPQAYTVSAKPGAINAVEGDASLNGQPLSEKGLRSVFLNANDTLSTDVGKAEVLLTPGVFLRVGEGSQVRMISPSLTNTRVEVSRGEMMLEATGLLKDNSLQIINHGSSTMIEKNGLYRLTADNPPTAAVLEGKAAVVFGDRRVTLKKGKQTVLAENLKAEKFDAKQSDDLYAWSNVRSEYEAAASYRVSQNAYNGGWGGGYGYGLNSSFSPGWYWDNGFNSWAWLPGAGAFYSPFGYGFYSPGLVAYAPVVVAPVYRGGTAVYGPGQVHRGPINGWRGHPGPPGTVVGSPGIVTHVPISPKNPPAMGATGAMAASPWANQAARTEAARSGAWSGFRADSGTPAPSFAGRGAAMAPARSAGWGGGRSASGSFHASSGSAGGGFHGGGGSAGGGHAGGGAAHR